MGELYLHNLDKFKCKVFIETGTGKGTGLKHALQFNFEKLFSIEINEHLYQECRFKFNLPRVNLVNASSIEGLKKILPTISKEDKILFWLDAHFPGADFQLGSYDDPIDLNLKLPLRKEIEVICDYRKNCKDTFIIDDLQLFEEGNYELNQPESFLLKYRTSNQFIYDLFGDSHSFTKDYRHQGFLILRPKDEINIP
jgi:hypothetical protein